MRHLQLETFFPDDTFTAVPEAAPAESATSAYERGFECGFMEGAEKSAQEHADAQDQLRQQFLEALNDAIQTRLESRVSVTKTLLPVLVELVHVLAPLLARAGLAAQIEAILARAFATLPDCRPTITCAPDLVAGLETALAQHVGRFALEGDPGMGVLEARLDWDNGFDALNLSACLQEIDALLSDFATLPETAEQRISTNVR